MEIRDLTAAGFRSFVDSARARACIDVRERGEFALEHIAGTTPMARGTLEYRIPSAVPDRKTPIALCCDDGRRSRLAAATLREIGYADVSVLAGGLRAWKQAGFPTREGWGVAGKEYGERVGQSERPPEIAARELYSRLRQGAKIAVVDVRTREEFIRAHVPGARHVPGGELLLRLTELGLEPDTEIVVSCAGRTRGILGAQMLREAGMEKVAVLTNGAMGWYLAGLDLEEGGDPIAETAAGSAPADGVERATRRLVEKEGIEFISVPAFDRLRAASDNVYIVDVRLPGEFAAARIPGSIPIPAGQLALTFENFIAVNRATIVVVADDAVRPAWAAALFKRLGFSPVVALRGGVAAWRQAGHPVERGEPEPRAHGLERARREVAGIGPSDLQALFTSGPRCLLLDVRGSGEFAFAHIPGARWLCRGRLELDWSGIAPPKERPVVTVCDNGLRSTLAAASLKSLGHSRARFLQGGMRAWREVGFAAEERLAGANVTLEEAQADFGHTLFKGPLAKSRPQMERYLSWEEALRTR